MRIRSFIIAYALVSPSCYSPTGGQVSIHQDRYSHVVDLTDGQSATVRGGAAEAATESKTRILAPAALIPGTWAAGQIPAERLIAPLVVLDLNAAAAAAADNSAQISPPRFSLDNIAAWESHHGMIPQGAVVAIRQAGDVLRDPGFRQRLLRVPCRCRSRTRRLCSDGGSLHDRLCRRNAGGPEFGSHPGAATRAAWGLCGGRNGALYFPAADRSLVIVAPSKKRSPAKRPCASRHGALEIAR